MKYTCAVLIVIASIAVTACSGGGVSGEDKTIKSAKSGEMTVTLSNSTGELRNGENELYVSFTDASGSPMEVEAASLNFHMAAMGTMPEMNNKARLTTTDKPGKFHARVDIEMAATWEAIVNYEATSGDGQARMIVNVK